MSTPSFSVTKSAGTFIRPTGPTPAGSLPLSHIDNMFSPGTFMERIIVFHHGGHNAADVVKQALGKALVPYYPLAGRLTRSEDGELSVDCTGDGVWFVEASADYDLPEHVLEIPRAELFSYPPNLAGLLVIFQVTQFTSGGSLVSLVFEHCIADEIGFAQFTSAVGEIARGSPIVEPIWCRDALPGPPKLSSKPPPPPSPTPSALPPAARNSYYHVDITANQISKLKDQYQEQTGKHCSTFDLLTAITWQTRARAIDLEPDADVNLGFPASIHHLLCQQLPDRGAGYYGNCVHPLIVTVPHQKLVAAPTTEVVDLIKDAKAGLTDQVSKWLKGEKCTRLPFGYNSMFVGNMVRLGFEEMDFGWGKPDYTAPAIDDVPSPVTFLVKSPTPMKGVRLVTKCVVEENLSTFQDELLKAIDT